MSMPNEYNPSQESNSRPNRPMWTEDMAKQGLAVLNYPGKWSQAQRMCRNRVHFTGPYKGYSYWERVHCMFLELGGCFVNQLLPYQQAAYESVATTGGAPMADADNVTDSGARAFGGSDELKASLRAFWAGELDRDLIAIGLRKKEG